MILRNLALALALAAASTCAAFQPHAPLLTKPSMANRVNRHATKSSNLVMRDYPKPNVEDTDNYRYAEAMSQSFQTTLKADPSQKKKVAIIGGGLAGLWCAKYLSDAGHRLRRIVLMVNGLPRQEYIYKRNQCDPGATRSGFLIQDAKQKLLG